MSRSPDFGELSRAAAIALAAAAVALWAALIAGPLVLLYAAPIPPQAPRAASTVSAGLVAKSFGIAAALAAGSVVLGYVPGRLLGTAQGRQAAALLLLLAPLLLPPHLLLYAWELIRSPTTPLGDFLSRRPAWARAASAATSSLTMLLWYWPLAALLIAQGFRALDRDVYRMALLDAGPVRRLIRVTLPLLAPALLLAFGLCLVMILGEFATFHLAGIDTLGTALAVVFAETQSAGRVARAAWPAAIPAAIVAAALWRRSVDWSAQPPLAPPPPPGRPARSWAVLAALLALTAGVPVLLLAISIRDARPFLDFWTLHREELGTSLLAASAAAAAAVVMAAGALALGGLGRPGRAAAAIVQPTMLLAALLPGSLIGAALVAVQSWLRAHAGMAEGWWTISAGLAARFAGVVLVLLRFGADARSRHLSELAACDGAGWARTWWHIHLPTMWQLPVAAMILATMLGLTELPATTVLLPAGVPSFAQGLLNQMHYARDQQVIATCLVLVGGYAVLGGAAVAAAALRRRVRQASWTAAVCLAGLAGVVLCGCESRPAGQPEVLRSFGTTGRGPGELIYPRAIDLAGDGTLWVADKTGRIQHLDAMGGSLDGFELPQSDAGKPTGLSVGPDGNIYVADTHYHRVAVYSQVGKELRSFGSYGQKAGQFIYPTDVAFAPDGRIFVSEYGGNDRVSIFTGDGRFLGSFGSFGDGPGQLSRPSALVTDAQRSWLYVADACNHRIAVYDLSGKLLRYFGAVGGDAGQLRYPYGLARLADGRIAVCEFGNNRVQVFSPEGTSLAVLGGPGRQLGQLAYPWGVAVDAQGLAYIVDAGNNRIQVWRLP